MEVSEGRLEISEGLVNWRVCSCRRSSLQEGCPMKMSQCIVDKPELDKACARLPFQFARNSCYEGAALFSVYCS